MIDQTGVNIIVGFTVPIVVGGLAWVGVYESVVSGKFKLQRHDIRKTLDVSKVQIKDHEKIFEKVQRVYKEENKEFMEHLNKYEDFLNSKPHINKEFYNKNISEATIMYYDNKTQKKYNQGKTTTSASFDVILGKLYIRLMRGKYIKNIYHELSHLSSYFKKGDIAYHGFRQMDTNTGYSIGVGINEGFTEVINRTYFEKDSHSYEVAYTIAERHSKIIGLEKMETLYFNADLKGLVDEIMKCGVSKEEVYKFIINLDLYYKIDHEYKKNNKFAINALVKCEYELNKFLIKLYVNKKTIDEPTINIKDLKKGTETFIDKHFLRSLKVGSSKKYPSSIRGKTFDITTSEQMKKYIDDAIDEVKHKDVA